MPKHLRYGLIAYDTNTGVREAMPPYQISHLCGLSADADKCKPEDLPAAGAKQCALSDATQSWVHEVLWHDYRCRFVAGALLLHNRCRGVVVEVSYVDTNSMVFANRCACDNVWDISFFVEPHVNTDEEPSAHGKKLCLTYPPSLRA